MVVMKVEIVDGFASWEKSTILRLPRKLHFKVHKVLRLPAPATKSALQGPQSTAPATKFSLQGPQSTAPVTKSALQGLQNTAPATRCALQEVLPATISVNEPHVQIRARRRPPPCPKYCARYEICTSRSKKVHLPRQGLRSTCHGSTPRPTSW